MDQPWKPYPEVIRETPKGQLSVEVSTPDFYHVVMGAAGKTEREVNLAELRAAGIPLFKRKGGGGTVLLGPGTLVVTLHAGVAFPYRNLAYFQAINRAIIRVFEHWALISYEQKGISDIAVATKKIVGSSIFRRRQYLLFQASILMDLNLELMVRLLKHPPRQPDYRGDRSHADFVTSLRALGIGLAPAEMAADLTRLLPRYAVAEINRVDRG